MSARITRRRSEEWGGSGSGAAMGRQKSRVAMRVEHCNFRRTRLVRAGQFRRRFVTRPWRFGAVMNERQRWVRRGKPDSWGKMVVNPRLRYRRRGALIPDNGRELWVRAFRLIALSEPVREKYSRWGNGSSSNCGESVVGTEPSTQWRKWNSRSRGTSARWNSVTGMCSEEDRLGTTMVRGLVGPLLDSNSWSN